MNPPDNRPTADATEFATTIGLEELKARMDVLGKNPHVGKDEKAVLDKFFDDQGFKFVNRNDDEILKALK